VVSCALLGKDHTLLQQSSLMEQWRSRKNPQQELLKLMGIVFGYSMKIKICWTRRWMGWTWLLPHTFHLEQVSTPHTFSLHFIHIEYIEDNAWIKCGGVGRFPPFLILFSICFVFPFLILFSVCFYLKKKVSVFNKAYWHWILGFDSLIGTVIIMGK